MEESGTTPDRSRVWRVLAPIGWLLLGVVLAKLAWDYLHPYDGLAAIVFCAFAAYLVLRAVQVVLIASSAVISLALRR